MNYLFQGNQFNFLVTKFLITLINSSIFLLKSFKYLLKCIPGFDAAYKIFPLRHVLYSIPYKKLFIEPTAAISLSESTYCPPDPSNILRSDKKSDISVWNNSRKIKWLSKIGLSSDWICYLYSNQVISNQTIILTTPIICNMWLIHSFFYDIYYCRRKLNWFPIAYKLFCWVILRPSCIPSSPHWNRIE